MGMNDICGCTARISEATTFKPTTLTADAEWFPLIAFHSPLSIPLKWKMLALCFYLTANQVDLQGYGAGGAVEEGC